MSLGAPAALWGLLILPAVLLLYLLRARRQEVVVSSVLLWERAARDLRAHRPLRRLERSLLLALQLLILALGVLALARPQRLLPGAEALVVVVDTSASMQATDVAPSRFEVARQMARREVAGSRGPVAVVAAGPQALLVQGPGPAADALRAVDRLRATDGGSAMDQAVALALARLPGGGSGRVVVITDRAGPALPGVSYRIVGSSDRNVGIAGIFADRLPDGTAVLVRVANAGREAVQVPVEVALQGRTLLRRQVSVPPGGTTVVPLRVTGSGVLTARLAARDALAVDDAAAAVLPPPPQVVVAGEDDPTLVQALAASGADVVTGSEVTAQALARADVVVLTRPPGADLPAGRYLLVGTVAPPLPVSVDGEAVGLQVARWSRSHPLMRYVDLRGVSVSRALALRPAGGEVLAWGEWPLIWAYEGGGIRAVVVAAALDQTDLPLHPAFPIFVRNALAWLAGPSAVRAGDPLTVPVASDAVTVVGPDGAARTVRARGGMVSLVFERAGLYLLQDGDRMRWVAASAPPEESAIAPVFPAPVAAEAGRSASPAASRAVDLSPVALAAAVLLAVVEWAVYLRTLPRRAASGPAMRLRQAGVRR